MADLWHRPLMKGLIFKKKIGEEILTEEAFVARNLRLGLRRVIPLGLVSSINVLNRHTNSGGNFTSYYTRGGMSRFGGGNMSGKSQQIGDLHIQVLNQNGYTLRNVPDPQGLRDLILSLVRSHIDRRALT